MGGQKLTNLDINQSKIIKKFEEVSHNIFLQT